MALRQHAWMNAGGGILVTVGPPGCTLESSSVRRETPSPDAVKKALAALSKPTKAKPAAQEKSGPVSFFTFAKDRR